MSAARTLSLADVARLAHVERPVVSMWRKRPLAAAAFPVPLPDGRFLADEMAAYLEATGRGNNPDARTDIALEGIVSAQTRPQTLRQFLALLAARALLGVPLSTFDEDSLVDAVDERDPDDDWLLSEIEEIPLEDMLGQVDSLVEAAWSIPNAYEKLLAVADRREDVRRLLGPFAQTLAGIVTALLGEHGHVVDVAGQSTDVVVSLLANEDLPEVPVVLPSPPQGCRAARQRLAAHGASVIPRELDDDWQLPSGSVIVALLPDDPATAFDLLDEVALHLAPGITAVVVGADAVLTERLAGDLMTRRDQFLRDDQVAAIVRLPQGLLADGKRGHLGLWLMRADAPQVLRVGDVSAAPLDSARAQRLLDDVVAAEDDSHDRAFALLQRTTRAHLLTRDASLVSLPHARPVEVPASPADDAAHLQHLLAALAAPLDAIDALVSLRADEPPQPTVITLGDAAKNHLVSVHSGARTTGLPTGSTRLWDSEAVHGGTPGGIDLLALTQASASATLTRPGDVVFVAKGQPRAVVDREGGAAVAYPARVIRVGAETPLSPGSIAACINALPQGAGNWRAWQVPVLDRDAAHVEDMFARLDAYAAGLKARQNQIDELRRLTNRSATSGAVRFHFPNEKGQ